MDHPWFKQIIKVFNKHLIWAEEKSGDAYFSALPSRRVTERERERERESEFAQLCPTLCDPMGCRSLLCSSVHRILQARVLEWVAISFSRGSPWPRDWTRVSRIVGTRFTVWATRGIPGGYHAKRNLQSDCGSLDFFGFESSFMSSVYF